MIFYLFDKETKTFVGEIDTTEKPDNATEVSPFTEDKFGRLVGDVGATFDGEKWVAPIREEDTTKLALGTLSKQLAEVVTQNKAISLALGQITKQIATEKGAE